MCAAARERIESRVTPARTMSSRGGVINSVAVWEGQRAIERVERASVRSERGKRRGEEGEGRRRDVLPSGCERTAQRFIVPASCFVMIRQFVHEIDGRTRGEEEERE